MPVLYVQQPNGNDLEIAVVKLRTTLGRSSFNDICLSDPFASRLHAEIRREEGSFFLTDLGSANGTYYNGAKLIDSVLLQPGDIIRIGETLIHFNESAPLETSISNIFLSDSDWTSSAEATIVGRSSPQSEKADLLSVINEITVRDQINSPISSPEFEVTVEKQRNLLAIVSKVVETLLSERSLDQTLRRILDLVFDAATPERGYIFLTDPSGELILKASHSLQKTSEFIPEEIKISRSICDKVVGQCTSVLTSDAQQDPRFALSHSLALSNIRSIMAVPLALNDEVLGMIYVDSLYATNRFSQEDLSVLTTIARVAAIKVENARLMEDQLEKKRMDEELKVASEIQLSLHPARPPVIEGYDVIGRSFPCREIGGDYYDFIRRRKGTWILALGDVSGKGTGAALMMSSLHAALRAQAQTDCLVEEVVSEVNYYIAENSPENKFLTLFCAELDLSKHILRYTNAGHNPGILVRADSSVVELKVGGLPVGITTSFSYIAEEVPIYPGDILVIYSDGITESTNEADEEFGEKRLIEVIKNNQLATAVQLSNRIDEVFSQFLGKIAPSDDMTWVIMKRLG